MSTLGADIKPIVIAGMGPGGLSAAIVAAQKGYPVIILEPRHNFSRGQRVQIDKTSLDFLNSLRDLESTEDDHFFNDQLFNQAKTVQVKDVQAFLTRKLEKIGEEKKNVDIRRGKGNQITAINTTSQIITLKKPDGSSDEIHFQHVVAADGARHGVTELFNQAVSEQQQIHYSPLAYQPRQEQVGTVLLQAKKGVALNNSDEPDKTFNTSHLAKLNEYGWDQPYFPRVYLLKNKDSTKFFVSGEVPKSILNIKNKDDQEKLLEEWGKFIVNVKLGHSAENLEISHKTQDPKKSTEQNKRIEEKNLLKATAFKFSLSVADKSSVALGDGGAFVLIGDAFKNANFFLGHGMNDAIQDGKKFAESLSGPSADFNFQVFDTHQKNQKRVLESKMRLSIPTESHLKGILENLQNKVNDLINIALKSNDDKVKLALTKLQALEGPQTANFDSRLYQMQVNELEGSLIQYLTTAENKVTSNKKGLFVAKDAVKIDKKIKDVKDTSSAIAGIFKEFFNTNEAQRESFKQAVDKKNQPRL